jgi:uncharacterized OB-fold protein
MSAYTKPLPRLDDANAPFWEAARAHELGTVSSWCRFHQVYFEGFGEDVPYTVIVVELEEGPRLFSNLVEAPEGEIEIGLPVEVMFDDVTPEVTLVKFKPAS